MGRVELTTLTKEFFMPRSLNAMKRFRREPRAPYAWDGCRRSPAVWRDGEEHRRRCVLIEHEFFPSHPRLRRGRPYESLDKLEVKDHRTGRGQSHVSSVNAGVIRKIFSTSPSRAQR